MHYKIHPLIALINTFNDSGDKKKYVCWNEQAIYIKKINTYLVKNLTLSLVVPKIKCRMNPSLIDQWICKWWRSRQGIHLDMLTSALFPTTTFSMTTSIPSIKIRDNITTNLEKVDSNHKKQNIEWNLNFFESFNSNKTRRWCWRLVTLVDHR